ELITNHWVCPVGFIDKRTDEGRRRLDQIFRRATILIVPSLAECYGLVYCEANAYALPAVGCDVGGVSTIIRDGENGFLVEPGRFQACEADRLVALLKSPKDYKRMASQARGEYEKRLNWKVAGRRASEIIEACVEIHQSGIKREAPEKA
ncbi:MAG: glycosyltransferase family 4 protein, partial [Verrucomicrobiota bacterium]